MPKIAKDAIDIMFDYGVDQLNRRIFLYGDIEEETVRDVVKGIYLMQDDEESIEIYISTCGGDEYEMFGLYDVIRNSKCNIITVGVGKIMSAGPLLLAAGDERIAFPNTSFMVHESWWEEGPSHFSQKKVTLEHYKWLHERWFECMVERTGTNIRTWRKLCSGPDSFFGAEKAKELGIIDKIVGDK